MAKTVGFACNIKPDWIKRTIQLTEEDLDKNSFKQQLNEYLKSEIGSPTRLRKIREILMNMWYYDLPDINNFRETARDLLKKYPEYFIPINLCLICINYPVVSDLCKIIGRLFESHDEITTNMVKQKLFDEWGENSTLNYISTRLILTLKDMGILEEASRFRYVVKKSLISNDDVVVFLINVAMKIDDSEYYSFRELNNFEILFPFEYNINKERFLTDKRFIIHSFGGEITISNSYK